MNNLMEGKKLEGKEKGLYHKLGSLFQFLALNARASRLESVSVVVAPIAAIETAIQHYSSLTRIGVRTTVAG